MSKRVFTLTEIASIGLDNGFKTGPLAKEWAEGMWCPEENPQGYSEEFVADMAKEQAPMWDSPVVTSLQEFIKIVRDAGGTSDEEELLKEVWNDYNKEGFIVHTGWLKSFAREQAIIVGDIPDNNKPSEEEWNKLWKEAGLPGEEDLNFIKISSCLPILELASSRVWPPRERLLTLLKRTKEEYDKQ